MSAREILGSPGRRPSAVRSVTDGEMGRWFFEVPGVPVPADKVRELTDTAVRRSAGDARDSRVGPQGRLSDEGGRDTAWNAAPPYSPTCHPPDQAPSLALGRVTTRDTADLLRRRRAADRSVGHVPDTRPAREHGMKESET